MSVVDPRQRYLEEVRRFPLSESLTDMEVLFEEDLELSSISPEKVVFHEKHSYNGRYSVGRVFMYRDSRSQELYIYLGLTYSVDGNGRRYPSGFFFGSDVDGRKLSEFLQSIQGNLNYINIKNVLDRRYKMGGGTEGSAFLTSVESHKNSKKAPYEDAQHLTIGSRLSKLKAILDREM